MSRYRRRPGYRGRTVGRSRCRPDHQESAEDIKRPLDLHITDTAEDDLAEIWAFIAEDAPDAATRFIHEIEERFEPLLHSPEIGPKRDFITPGLRAHFHKSYGIYYRITDAELIIMRAAAVPAAT